MRDRLVGSRRGLLAVALCGVLVLSSFPAVAAANERVVRVPYDTAPPGPLATTEAPNPTPLRDWQPFQLGGATVEIDPDEEHVEVFVLDLAGWRAPGRMVFYDQDGAQVGFFDFCDRFSTGIPDEAAEVTVFASSLVTTCPVDGLNYGPATSGELVVTFT